MSAITTHVLDTAQGQPARGVPVTLARLDDAGEVSAQWSGQTDEDGRTTDLMGDEPLATGDYRLTFHISDYTTAKNVSSFFPQVDITFTVSNAKQHYHVPLLLSPYGFSTYRGS